MSAGRRRGEHRKPRTIAELVGRLVEVRTQGGGCHRGRLLNVTDELLCIRRPSNGRAAFVTRATLVSVLDEGPSGPGEGPED